jgi:hypothetical protein
MLKLVIFAMAPIIAIMIIEATPNSFLLTEKWLSAAPYFKFYLYRDYYILFMLII